MKYLIEEVSLIVLTMFTDANSNKVVCVLSEMPRIMGLLIFINSKTYSIQFSSSLRAK
jgi:hypothetical protein